LTPVESHTESVTSVAESFLAELGIDRRIAERKPFSLFPNDQMCPYSE
jgi:hypothetical protein